MCDHASLHRKWKIKQRRLKGYRQMMYAIVNLAQEKLISKEWQVVQECYKHKTQKIHTGKGGFLMAEWKRVAHVCSGMVRSQQSSVNI